MVGGEVKIFETVVDKPSTTRMTWENWLERKPSREEVDDGLMSSSLSSTLLEFVIGEGERKMLATLSEKCDMVDLWSLVCTGIEEGRNQKTQLVLKRKKIKGISRF